MQFALVPPAMLCVLALLAGCSKQPSAEQNAADAAFATAKTALARGSFQQACASLISASRLDQGLGRTARVAESQRLLGDIYAATASFDSAIQFYANAADQFRSLADRQSVRAMTLTTVSVYRMMGEERKAYTLCSDALRLTRVFNDEAGVREIEWALLPICRALDQRDEEATIVADLTRQYSAKGEEGKLARVLLESGISSYQRSAYELAGQNFLRAAGLADQSRDSVLGATAMLRAAMTFEAAGNMRDGIQRYADALKRVGKMSSAAALRCEMLTRVGNLYLRSRQPGEAKRFYRAGIASAMSGGDRILEGYLFVQLGHCEGETTRDAALKSYQTALQLFKEIGYSAGIAYAQLSLGALAVKGNQAVEAIDYFKKSIEQSESVQLPRSIDDLYAECEGAFFEGSRYPAYDELADLLLQTGRYDEAFWYSERKNSNALFRAVSSFEPPPAKGALASDLAQFQHIRALRKGAENQLQRLLTSTPRQKELLEGVLKACNETAEAMAQKGEPIVQANRALEPFVRISSSSPAEIAKQLPQGTALVMPIPAKRSLFTFVVTNAKSIVQIAAVERGRIVGLAHDYFELFHAREALSDSTKAPIPVVDQKFLELSRFLSEAFVRPLENEIKDAQRLLVVLPPEFPWLPFHALKTGLLPTSPFVAERQLVKYLPYAGVLLYPTSRSGPVRDVVGFGFQGNSSWDVEYELRDIRAFYKDARLYFSDQATIEVLEKERADVLHLTSDIECVGTAAANSFVILSDGKSATTSKKILLSELFSLPPFPTVVVSNISSSPNRIDRTIPYIFLADGAASVVVNAITPLRRTKKFFGEVFYTALLGGSTGEAAFRKVQIEMIKDPLYTSPFVWGPFFLWGK